MMDRRLHDDRTPRPVNPNRSRLIRTALLSRWHFDDLLHETLAERSGNPLPAKTIREMRRHTRIFGRQTVPARSRPGIDHRRILAALSQTDGE